MNPTMLLLSLVLQGQEPRGPSRGALADGVVAIENVSVVPMNAETVLAARTVLVRNGRIASVTSARQARIPADARRIDGRGRFLIPGLADMHTHLFSDDAVPDSAGPAELGVILANGVTAARLMIGTPEHLAYRRDIAAGTIAGPQLFVASPQLIGREDQNARAARTPEEARAAVQAVASEGYDFIKLTLDISPPVYEAIVQEAARLGVPVVGHVDQRIGVARALAAGQHIEHLDNYLEASLADSAPMRTSVSDLGLFRLQNWESLDHMDDAKMARLAGETARSGTYTTPTLNMFRSAFALGQTDQEIRSRPDWDMMPPQWRRGYLTARQRFWGNPPSEARRRRYEQVRSRLVKAIADSGGRVMAGSDSPEWLHVYGFALHRELEALVAAGLSPYQALAAATVRPAAFVGASREWGTIEAGKRADMLLIEGNPLADIRNTSRIHAVSFGGRWLDRAELDEMIRRGTRAINGAAPDSLRLGSAAAVRSLAATGLARPSELAPNVHAVTRAEPLGLAGNANSLVIVGDTDVVVVDAQFTRQATLETIAAIRQITPKPVGVVINTHWHDDHVAGNQVYRDSFPAARFIMHANTAADLQSLGVPNRAGTARGAPPMADRFVRLLGMGLGVDSTPVTPAERTSVTNAVRIMRQYLAEIPTFRDVPVTELVQDRLTLRRGAFTVDVRWFGCANTRGDLVVHVPEAGVVATGDLVVHPVPFGFNSYPAGWRAALDSVIALRPRIVVPGHGPVMRDLEYATRMRDMMAAPDSSAREAFRPAGGEKWMDWMFTNFFLNPLQRPPAQLIGC